MVDFSTDPGTFFAEIVPFTPTVIAELGRSILNLDLAITDPQTKNDSINFTLNNGDEFFVWADLDATGTRGGFGDSFDTLTMSFSDPTGIAPVPVPAAVWLMASGLLGLVGAARRKHA